MAGQIYPKYKSAKMIAGDFRKATGKKITPSFVHWLAGKKGFQKHYYGKEIYYASNLRTIVDANYYTMYPVYLEELEKKKAENKPRVADYDPDAWIEGNRNPRFESIISRVVTESIRKILNDRLC